MATLLCGLNECPRIPIYLPDIYVKMIYNGDNDYVITACVVLTLQ